jgi:P-type Ca2+ transporter type 2C
VGLELAELVAADPVHDERPFTRTVARRNGRLETLILGAPEAVADLVLGRGGTARAAWHASIEAAVGRSERVVGLARRLDDEPWQLEALIGFADALRSGIVDAVTDARTAGIQVVMVTGDHPGTARSIAEEAGLGTRGVVLGSEVEGWSDDQLARRLPDLVAIARSTPDLKRRIVDCARAAGRLVAVTGDGVNDAPALHHADVAVAMGSGTAVAREASDLVLGDDSFATLVFGIAEGRRIVDNVQKGLVFLVSTHVALLGFLLIATLAGFSQPLIPIQILWLELFIDGSTSIAFEREPAEPHLMTRPPRHVALPLLTRRLLGQITLAGGFSAVAALGLLTGALGGSAHGQWLAYTALVCAQAVRGYANRSLTQPLRRLSSNGVLLIACIAVIVVQVGIPFVPALADAFRAVPLTLPEWSLVALIALAPAIVAELVRTTGRTSWVA